MKFANPIFCTRVGAPFCKRARRCHVHGSNKVHPAEFRKWSAPVDALPCKVFPMVSCASGGEPIREVPQCGSGQAAEIAFC